MLRDETGIQRHEQIERLVGQTKILRVVPVNENDLRVGRSVL